MKKTGSNILIALFHLGLVWPIEVYASGKSSTVQMLMNKCRKAINYDEGGELEKNTIDIIKAFEHGECLGSIWSTISTYRVLEEPVFMDINKICIPPGWNPAQGMRIFVQWADENPEALHWRAELGVLTSHLLAFPCKSNN